MQDSFDKKKHTLYLENRSTLQLEGINDVDAFNEEEITASCDWGDILIKGASLHVETLDLESGLLKISGTVSALVYHDRTAAKGLLKKVFSS